jgi:hypothetical protein
MPNTQEIINHFHTLTDDDTTLSSDEELLLAEKVYRKILRRANWEFLRTPFNGTSSISVPYISLPVDFRSVIPVNGRNIIYYGSANSEYRLIPNQRRLDYDGNDGYVYLDMKNKRLVFTKQPTEAKTIQFDYLYRPDDLALDEEPVFDKDYHYAISHGMVSDYYIADQTPKGRTYYAENEGKYEEYIQSMLMDNALLISNYQDGD